MNTRFKNLRDANFLEKLDVSVFWLLDVLPKNYYDLPLRRANADIDKLDQDMVSDLIAIKIKKNNQTRFLTPRSDENKHL
jgi:hypothetical protein